MNFDLVNRLVVYIAYQGYLLHASLTAKQVIKLLYLVDLEYYQRHRRLLTDIPWIRYLYGPYFMNWPEVAKTTGLGLEREEVKTSRNLTAHVFSTRREQDLHNIVHYATQSMIDQIARHWIPESVDDLLSYVYDTPPVRTAAFGDRLNFATAVNMERKDDLIVEGLSDDALDTIAEYLLNKNAELYRRLAG